LPEPSELIEPTAAVEGAGATASLLACLGRIPDARRARGVRYPQAALLALCVVGFICGRQNLTQLRRFARDHLDLLPQLGFTRRRAPSVPTLSRVLGAVAIGALQEAIVEWLGGRVDSQRKRKACRVAAVDGKTSRASGVHVLNVFLHDVEQVLWQLPVGEKANEITALKQSLAELLAAYPFLQILTGDAMFTGEPLCADLIGHGRHYVFQVKADQKHLLEKMELVFAAKLHGAVAPASLSGEKKGRLRHRP
jgi:hypothetical protein